MTESSKLLIKQLSDPLKRSLARDQLINKGSAAVEDMLAALEREPPLSQKKDLMRILLELKDPRTVDLFRQSVNSDDEEIRAISATGLFRLGAPDALDACLATINDSPDMLHYDLTPSVRALSEMGIGVLSSIIPLLGAENKRTRQHAQGVLERVTFKEITKLHESPAPSTKAKSAWKTLWEKNGPYRWDAPEDQRETAINRWQRWLAEYSNDISP